MVELNPQQLGKIILLIGLGFAAMGLIVMLLASLGLFKLPGDLTFSGKNWKIYFPLASCILLSIIMTLILWLISLLRR